MPRLHVEMALAMAPTVPVPCHPSHTLPLATRSRFSAEKLNAPPGFFASLVPKVVEMLSDAFPEVRESCYLPTLSATHHHFSSTRAAQSHARPSHYISTISITS